MRPASLSTSTTIVRNAGFSETALDDEIVTLSVEKGACYGFNPIGSRIWQLLAQPITVDDVCRVLTSEYQIDRETCEREVLTFLELLYAEGMVAPA